uniref:Uncharacterized protein n=1 Tax=Romanomermis culicivorax TaxID=13658 RepID=A0A915JW60_ROMCU
MDRCTIPGSGNGGDDWRSREDCQSGQIDSGSTAGIVAGKKSVICIAVAVISDGAVGIRRADTSVDGGSFAMLKSKIDVSKSFSWAGSTSVLVGRSSSSSALSVCTKAVVSMGHAYTGVGNENQFWKSMMVRNIE